MTFKVDQNLPVEVADLLRSTGHAAATVHEEGLAGADDDVLAEHVRREGRILVTLDLDFSDIRVYPPHEFHGIIVLRSKRQDKTTLLALVERGIFLLTAENPKGKLWIIESDRVRIR